MKAKPWIVFFVIAVVLLSVVLAGCSQPKAGTNQGTNQQSNSDTVTTGKNPVSSGGGGTGTVAAAAASSSSSGGAGGGGGAVTTNFSAGHVREFIMTAKQWEFVPNTIEVNKGDRVRLKITSIDVKHGIAIPDFGIDNVVLNPGKTETVEFTADKTGTFSPGMICTVYCGEGHAGMKGTIIVKP